MLGSGVQGWKMGKAHFNSISYIYYIYILYHIYNILYIISYIYIILYIIDISYIYIYTTYILYIYILRHMKKIHYTDPFNLASSASEAPKLCFPRGLWRFPGRTGLAELAECRAG